MKYSSILLVVALVALTGCGSMPVSKIKFKDAVLSKEISKDFSLAPIGITKTFSLSDPIVNILVTVKWDEVEKAAGVQPIRWEWFTDGKLVSQVKASFNFYSTPFSILGTMPTRNLGLGKHSVKLYVNDQLFSEEEFEISDKKG